jgi:hypothetical protein
MIMFLKQTLFIPPLENQPGNVYRALMGNFYKSLSPAMRKNLPVRIKRPFLLAIALLAFSACPKGNATFVISGNVADFHGNPVAGATIRLKNRAFANLYETMSDKRGNYSMAVKEGDYYCLYAIKLSEYRVNRLEYWAWNVPVHSDMVINPRYDRMEIYGINVFEPQVTPQETYMVYFRPMSLVKTLAVAARREVDEKNFRSAGRAEGLLSLTGQLTDMAPDSITAAELTVEVNGARAEIVAINKIKEYARGFFMYGYLVQILKPKDDRRLELKYDTISITLHSAETGESGKGETFVKRR